jgi:hypothetical protein
MRRTSGSLRFRSSGGRYAERVQGTVQQPRASKPAWMRTRRIPGRGCRLWKAPLAEERAWDRLRRGTGAIPAGDVAVTRPTCQIVACRE